MRKIFRRVKYDFKKRFVEHFFRMPGFYNSFNTNGTIIIY